MILFCFHFSNKLDENQISFGKSSIEAGTSQQFTFIHPEDEDPDLICVNVEAKIEFPKEYLHRLTIAFSDPALAIAYSDLSWKGAGTGEPVKSLIPDWSPERYLAIDYLGPVLAVAKNRIAGLENKQEYCRTEVILQAIENGSRIERIRNLSYLQLSDQHFDAADKRRELVERFLDSNREGASISSINGNIQQIVYSNSKVVTTSLIILTRGSCLPNSKVPMILNCVESLIQQATNNLEVQIIVVYDTDTDLGYLDELRTLINDSLFSLLLIPYDPPFNFSKKCNLGVSFATGQVLIFLNDDTYCISKNVITELTALAQITDVGAVGAKLFFGEGLIQHGGYVIRSGNVSHAYIHENDGPRVFGDLLVTHEVGGVTGACLAQRREIFELIGKWDETLPSSYNDVDYCFRTISRGYRILQANNVVLTHYESITRNPLVTKSDRQVIRELWPVNLSRERYMRAVTNSKEARPGGENLFHAYLQYAIKTFRYQGIRGIASIAVNAIAKSIALLGRKLSKDN